MDIRITRIDQMKNKEVKSNRMKNKAWTCASPWCTTTNKQHSIFPFFKKKTYDCLHEVRVDPKWPMPWPRMAIPALVRRSWLRWDPKTILVVLPVSWCDDFPKSWRRGISTWICVPIPTWRFVSRENSNTNSIAPVKNRIGDCPIHNTISMPW